MDKLPKSVTGWINSMDEITVVHRGKPQHYVEHHAAEFADGAATKGSGRLLESCNADVPEGH